MKATLRMLIALALVGAACAAPATASYGRGSAGSFPIEDQFLVEPDSTTCGFPITLTITGMGHFNVVVDAAGDPVRLHILEHTVGTLSANGISLQDVASDNKLFDFQTQTVAEVGLVFRDFLPGSGVVISDRGRPIWTFDPETGETVGEPLFEAGPHPELHGDIAALCSALTP